MNRFFVAGIGTGIGKTLVSAILVEALGADYWKPIQAGNLEHTDTHSVRSLITRKDVVCHPESCRFSKACSPHAAAALDGVPIELSEIIPPTTASPLIIEGVGGLLVPLNNKALAIDLINHLESEVILVSQFYLGSINHTLLSLEALKAREIPVRGIIFNGEENAASREAIMSRTTVPCIGSIGHMREVTPVSVLQAAGQIDLELFK